MTAGGVGRAGRRWPPRRGLVNAVNFNIRFYPLNQHVREFVGDGGIGDVRLVTGRYFQDWLLHDTRLELAPRARPGGALRAVGDIGSHWLDLMTFVTGQHVEAVMADLATFIATRHEPTGPGRDVLDRAVAPRRSRATSRPRTPPRSCSASTAAPAASFASRRSARAARTRFIYEIDGSDCAGGLGLGAAGPAVDRPPRPAERDPAPRTRR